MIYCTALNPSLDVIYKVNELRSGSTITDVPLSLTPAGKGINVARVVKVLGEDVCIAGLMAEYDLNRTSEYLEQQGIEHRFTTVPGNMRINATIIEANNGSVSHINSCGPAVPSRIQHEFLDLQKSLLAHGDLWSFSGSIPKGFDDDCYRQMLKSCNEAGIETMFDSRGSTLKIGLRAKPLMIKPNLSELEDYFGEHIQGVHHIALKGKRLVDLGITYVFISLGADGMIAIHENDCLLCSAPQIKTVDTVGCGDALVGGVLVARKRCFSFSEMCRMAVACGASKALHEGPGNVVLDEVWQLMEDVNITAV